MSDLFQMQYQKKLISIMAGAARCSAVQRGAARCSAVQQRRMTPPIPETFTMWSSLAPRHGTKSELHIIPS